MDVVQRPEFLVERFAETPDIYWHGTICCPAAMHDST